MLRNIFPKISIRGTRRCSNQIPFNMNGIQMSEKLKNVDRSRDHSHQRLDLTDNVSADNSSEYDLDGNANLESIVQSYVPNPFIAQENMGALKEGQLCGMSDAPSDRTSQRWTMNDHLDSMK
ncbi:unnamed protein product [Lepeophtheirus salmonis]|uniref:(salmon louse) hypothetical protein n=1 Tax=Lepeophtheirus salmonis TaxID=72036 RepID=A0A0K2VBA3_LEPSM|nr:uncharacterized protein LOC121121808 [Lepeophtheirus salmonis]CAB4067567.1 unnamed protein product [Lepeophtheirus salmonis]CAF2991721.1 unnamed protein product [Lepeophtheirus salmonis]